MSLFSDIDAAIEQRLTAKLADLNPKPRILSGSDLENVKGRSQGDLSVYVAYNGIVSNNPMPNIPHIVEIEQEWFVWIVARSAKNHDSGKGTRELADPVMERVLEALTGWSAVPGRTLRLKPNPGPAYGDGFGWFPLVYGVKSQIKGNPN